MTGGKKKVPLPGWSEKMAQGILSGQFVKAWVTAKQRGPTCSVMCAPELATRWQRLSLPLPRSSFLFFGRRLSVCLIKKITREGTIDNKTRSRKDSLSLQVGDMSCLVEVCALSAFLVKLVLTQNYHCTLIMQQISLCRGDKVEWRSS